MESFEPIWGSRKGYGPLEVGKHVQICCPSAVTVVWGVSRRKRNYRWGGGYRVTENTEMVIASWMRMLMGERVCFCHVYYTFIFFFSKAPELTKNRIPRPVWCDFGLFFFIPQNTALR